MGAGVAIGNGGDDFKWATAWRTVPKSELRLTFRSAKADGILVDDPVADSAGGGHRPRQRSPAMEAVERLTAKLD
jgi:hypothetical protein